MPKMLDFIHEQRRGTFAAWYRGTGTKPYRVEFGKLERTPEITSLSAIRDFMRRMYGVRETSHNTRETPKSASDWPDSPMG